MRELTTFECAGDPRVISGAPPEDMRASDVRLLATLVFAISSIPDSIAYMTASGNVYLAGTVRDLATIVANEADWRDLPGDVLKEVRDIASHQVLESIFDVAYKESRDIALSLWSAEAEPPRREEPFGFARHVDGRDDEGGRPRWIGKVVTSGLPVDAVAVQAFQAGRIPANREIVREGCDVGSESPWSVEIGDGARIEVATVDWEEMSQATDPMSLMPVA